MDEGLKNKAYLEAMRLKNSGMDNEVIYARLEKQGIPDDLINQVIRNITIQKVVDKEKDKRLHHEAKSSMYIVKAGAGVLLAVMSYFVYPDKIMIPIGCILGGLGWALYHKIKS